VEPLPPGRRPISTTSAWPMRQASFVESSPEALAPMPYSSPPPSPMTENPWPSAFRPNPRLGRLRQTCRPAERGTSVGASERREIPGSLKSLVSFARDLRIRRGRMRAAIHYQWDQFRVGAGAAGFHRVLPSLSTWPPRRTATRSKEGEVRQTTSPRAASKEGSGPPSSPPGDSPSTYLPAVPTRPARPGCPSTGDNDGRTRRLPPGAQGRRTGPECELDGAWVQEEPAPEGPVLLSNVSESCLVGVPPNG
jgi:hypothetical protein